MNNSEQPMKSIRQIEREYSKLMELVKSNDYYTKIDLSNRVNWFRPTLKEIIKLRKTPDMIEYIMAGGLCRRKINPSS